MIRKTSLWTARIAAVALALALALVGAAWARLAAGPVSLHAITRAIEEQLSDAREGRPVEIETVELSWSGQPKALQILARNIRVLDAKRTIISRYESATIGLDALPLLIGRVALVRAEFTGGDITITRKRDGEAHLAFGPPGSAPDVIIPAPAPDEPLAQRIGKMLDGLARTLRPVGAGGPLRSLALRGAHLEILDEGAGAQWSASNAAFLLMRERSALSLAVEATLEGQDGAAPASLRVTTDTKFNSAVVEFGARDARPRALLSPAMLGVFAALDAPMTMAVTIGLDRDVGVNQFEGDISLGRGGARMAGQRFALDGGRLHGRYDLDNDVLVVDQLSLAGSRTRISGEARLQNASALLRSASEAPADFAIALPSLTLDVPGVFEAPFDLSRVEVSGRIEDDGVTVTRLIADRDQARLEASGRLWFARLGAGEGKLYPGIAVDGRITGRLEARSVVALWPIHFIEGARDYLDDAIVQGALSDAVIKINASPQEVAAEQLRDASLDIAFSYADSTVRYIDTMSPLTGARGRGVLKGNSFALTLDDARLDGLVVTAGRVDMPVLNPKGRPVTIEARAAGEARAFVGLLMQRPVALGPRMPLEPGGVGGRGTATLRLVRPNLSDVPFEQLRFTVDGRFEDVSGVMRERRLTLSHGQLHVRGDQQAIQISGPMRLGSSPVEVAWTERLGTDVKNSSRYQIAGQFDAGDLEELGYPARAVSQGCLRVAVSGEGQGFDVDIAQVTVDMREARAFLPRNFWVKPPGVPANARFDVSRNRAGEYVLSNVDVRGAGLSGRGEARVSADGEFLAVQIPRFTVEGRADLAMAGQRASDGALEFSARGAHLNVSPFLDVVESPGAPAATAPPPGRPAQIIRIHVRPERFELRANTNLSGASADLVLSDGALQTLEFAGRTPENKPLSLALGPRRADPQGRIAFASEDAGFAWRAFTGADNIIGGRVSAEGDWRMGPPSVAQFDLHMRDFRVVRVPAMAHLLGSVASLTGFVEMLNGDGIGFASLDAPVTMNADNLAFAQARMAGPTLGLTASGKYNMEADDLDVDGVVVPSYGLYSVLGNVPLLGALLTSRRGEGIFGMTYAVNGPAAAPRVGVNPLSALTPGILRRIFEPIAPRPSAPPAEPAPATRGG